MNQNIYADFQICISVPLRYQLQNLILLKHFCRYFKISILISSGDM